VRLLEAMTECGTRIDVTYDGEGRAATGRGRTLVLERGAVGGAWNEDAEGVLDVDATQATPVGRLQVASEGIRQRFRG
jgi:hypothetical protein